jgi:hypothetical protein
MTDFEDPSTYDDGYYSSLSPNDQDRFEDDFDKNLSNFDASAIRRTLKTKCNSQEEHLKLVKAIGACFHPKGGAATSSGFDFYGVNPLHGLKETPADAVIVNSEHNCVYVLLVLCEIGGEQRGSWVEHVNKTHRFFEKPDTKNKLREKLSVNHRDIEIGYVTLTREDDTIGIDFSVLNKQCDASPYAVWECDTNDRWIRHVDGSFIHPDLHDEFYDDGKKTYTDIDYSSRKEPINIAVGTHPVFPLEEVLFKIIKENKMFDADNIDEFERDSFLDYYDDQLKVFCHSSTEETVLESEVKRVLSAGTNARIITNDPSEVENGDYKVVYSGARGPEHAKNAVKARYLKYMPEYKVGSKAYEKTKDEFDKSTGLDDFT